MKKLSEKEIDDKLEKYEAWMYDEESKKLVAGFEFETFEEAIDFANGIADISIDASHYPDILMHDKKFVTVFINTSDIDGITNKDFELIKTIEKELEIVE